MIRLTSIKITDDEVRLVTNSLKSGYLVQGQLVEQLEKEIAEFIGVSHAIAVNTGTAALHTALHALGVKEGDEVITTPFSFVATANAILMCGATPVFADIDEKTFNLSPKSVESLISPKTKAVLGVDLYGNPLNYDELAKICRKHKLSLVADSCQALGSSYDDKKVGSLADISVFSLYASKNVFSGEGGIIVTNDSQLATACRLFRNHGQPQGKQYEYYALGYNYRLTDILAAIALPQIKNIEYITKTRQKNAEYLTKHLANVTGITAPSTEEKAEHCYHQYTVRVESDFSASRDELMRTLQSMGVETRLYYPQLLTTIPHVAAASRLGSLPTAQRIVNQVLSLPVHQHLTKTELDTIVKSIQKVANG